MDLLIPDADENRLITAPQHYASAWVMTFGPNEFTILPVQTQQIAGQDRGTLEEAPAFRYIASFWTSPQAARDFCLTLQSSLDQYEKINGKIPDTPFSRRFHQQDSDKQND